MAKRWERADIRLVSELGPASESLPLDEETPFVIAVFGDFTGHPVCDKAGDPVALGNRRPVEIDRDNFDAIMELLEVRFEANLVIGGGMGSQEWAVRILLRGLDSFHPDQLVSQVEPLRALLDLRRALEDPGKFNAAAAEIQKWITPPPDTGSIPKSSQPSNLLDAILAEADSSSGKTPRKDGAEDLERFVQEIVRPHVIRIDWGQQQQLIAAVEEALNQQIRSILHHKEFQRLEAAWRSLYFLVMNAETGARLKIYLFNVSKAELDTDLTNSPSVAESGLFKSLSSFVSESGGKPWSALIANYDFGIGPEDVSVLDRIAQVAQNLKAPFIAAASPQFFRGDSFLDLPSAKSLAQLFEKDPYGGWRSFRTSPQAQSVGLLLPRFLLRLPYGAQSDRIGSFEFEEGVSGKNHDKYVWGNPAFAFAVLLAREFTESGWSLDPARLAGPLEGMPLHIYQEGDTAETKPCCEVLLSDEIVGALEQEGFMVLVSYRDRDVIMIRCAQSVASPPAPLAGHW